jgi:hypothetical protein
VVSEHLNAAPRLAWPHTRWPKLLRQAQQRQALGLWGDEASFAPGGSLRSPGAPTGQPPEGPNSGKRTADHGGGLLDAFSGPWLSQAHAGRCHAESSTACGLDGLAHTPQHGGGMHDGARAPPRKAMPVFFEPHAERWPMAQLPADAPAFTPLAPRGKKVNKAATPRTPFPEFTALQHEVDRALLHCAQTPRAMTVLMARYWEKLGQVDKAA